MKLQALTCESLPAKGKSTVETGDELGEMMNEVVFIVTMTGGGTQDLKRHGSLRVRIRVSLGFTAAYRFHYDK